MAQYTHNNYSPHIGDFVRGKYGKHNVEGYVLEHPKHPRKPFVFNRWGCVLCYVEPTNMGARTKVAINEIELVGQNQSKPWR